LAKKLVANLELEAFRLSFNGGKFQHIPHIHMHLLAGSKIAWEKL
jgi:diadenosine tetraphosphate (Ap4A) HIT family hydrolase